MRTANIVNVEVLKVDISAKNVQKVVDCVAEEGPLHVSLNGTHYATILCSPSNLRELAIGRILSEGIIKSVKEIEDVTLRGGICRVKLKPYVKLEDRLKILQRFSPAVRLARVSWWPKALKIASGLTVGAKVVLDCVSKLNRLAETFRKTGGTHVAAIYDGNGELVALAEDVSRHNAVDKVIGIGALNERDFSKCFLALSGRLTGDIVLKAARVNIPIVASLTAAISSGIVIAKDVGLTLIGFARGKRMNVYTFPERIQLS